MNSAVCGAVHCRCNVIMFSKQSCERYRCDSHSRCFYFINFFSSLSVFLSLCAVLCVCVLCLLFVSQSTVIIFVRAQTTLNITFQFSSLTSSSTVRLAWLCIVDPHYLGSQLTPNPAISNLPLSQIPRILNPPLSQIPRYLKSPAISNPSYLKSPTISNPSLS